ncbi:hypothetical protein BDN71DRAFT_1439992 [Pleurotus eryngii]|uniref:F-box domain-containing protein n=1 Tax=Pleurotus eryngii TaxID=5323 RepID=A0A9P6A6P0_PLEER|nr:hypothetical protein BDN71DRAFT_1439992 [Pleurotus eryngii]
MDDSLISQDIVISDSQAENNLYSPIAKLYAELLGEIFVLAKTSTKSYSGKPSWLNVAGVCQAWREVALDTPRLWNRFDVSHIKHLEWASTILGRSGGLPLMIECTRPLNLKYLDILKTVVSHISRMRELDIYAQPDTLLSLFTSQPSTSPLSQLRSLSLTQSKGGEDSEPDRSQLWLQRVFEMAMPTLQTLKLVEVVLPLDIPAFPHLRRLEIATASIKVTTILSFLRNAPYLEELILIVHPFTGESVGTTSPTTIDLPNLKWLSLASTRFDTSVLFQYIHYHPSTRIQINMTKPFTPWLPQPNQTMQSFAGLVSHFASSDEATQIDSLFFLNNPAHGLHLKASTGDVASLDIRCDSVSPPDIGPTFGLLSILPQSNIRSFRISGLSRIGREAWMNLFRQQDHLQELEAEMVKEELVQMLLKSSEDEPTVLPELKRLAFRRCLFVDLVEYLKTFLKERKALGVSLDELKISKSGILPEEVLELRAHVRVDWDGLTYNDPYEDDPRSP